MMKPGLPDLSAEAYFLTAFPVDENEVERFFLDCQGTKSRGREREVLGETVRHTVLNHHFIEMRGLQVSRNGIYDLLPESMFHPLVLGKTSANTYEIVQEIRNIRAKEQDDRLFFMPWDTELFFWKVSLRKMELFPEREDQNLYANLLHAVYGSIPRFALNKEGLMLSFLVNGQRARDNSELVGQFLSRILECEVSIHPVLAMLHPLSGPSLGMASLGVDAVLHSTLAGEWMDWEVVIASNDAEKIRSSAVDPDLADELTSFVGHFALAQREVFLKWVARPEARSIELGSGLLGINAYIQHYA